MCVVRLGWGPYVHELGLVVGLIICFSNFGMLGACLLCRLSVCDLVGEGDGAHMRLRV